RPAATHADEPPLGDQHPRHPPFRKHHQDDPSRLKAAAAFENELVGDATGELEVDAHPIPTPPHDGSHFLLPGSNRKMRVRPVMGATRTANCTSSERR